MEIHVALSAERIDKRIVPFAPAVGMLRSEYLCRRIGKYFLDKSCRNYVQEYLQYILNIYHDKPVWYRFFDAPSHEVNMLEKHDVYIVEEAPLMGIRGMRRALRFPKTFELEFSLVAEIAAKNPNLNIIFPYVNEVEELLFGLEVAKKVGFSNRIGIMVETPAALFLVPEFYRLGLRHYLVGMNDLSSLMTGAHRGGGYDRHTHPSLALCLKNLRSDLPDSTLAVGGYLNATFIDMAKMIGCDYIVVHYSSFPLFFGEEFDHFHEIDFMKEFKHQDNKKRLLQWSHDLSKLAQKGHTMGLQGSDILMYENEQLPYNF